jgi:phage gp36-like protein
MYGTVAHIRASSPFKDSVNISDTYVTQLLTEASSLIDSYLVRVYTLPLATTPTIITHLAEDLATCFLFRDQNPNQEVAAGVNVEDQFKSLLEMLEAIASRETPLVDADGNEYALNGNSLPSSYPTDASSDPDYPDSTAPYFSRNQQF